MRDVAEFLQRNVPWGGEHDVSQVMGYVQAIYLRAVGLFRAAQLLIEHDKPEEALIIGRSLFTESLRLERLAKARREEGENGVAAFVLKWRLDGIQEIENLNAYAVRSGQADEDDSVRERFARERQQIERYRVRTGVGPLRPFGDEEQLARELGRADDIVPYRMAHQHAHGLGHAYVFRLSLREDGLVQIRDSAPAEVGMGTLVAATLSRSLLLAHRAAVELFDWPEPPELDGLLRRATVSTGSS
jgi:hypothetical protein